MLAETRILFSFAKQPSRVESEAAPKGRLRAVKRSTGVAPTFGYHSYRKANCITRGGFTVRNWPSTAGRS
jgi:hypothetical protein